MKKLLLPLFCFFLLAWVSSLGAKTTVIVYGGGGAAACNTEAETIDDLAGGGDNVGDIAGRCWAGASFDADSNFTPCAVQLGLASVTGTHQETTVSIQGNSCDPCDRTTDEPDGVDLCSGVISAGTMQAGFHANNKVSLAGCGGLNSGTIYFVVVTVGTGNHNGAHYFSWDTGDAPNSSDPEGAGPPDENQQEGADGITWGDESITKTFSFKVFKQ